jgi:uncharacterized protein (DUF2336 family)
MGVSTLRINLSEADIRSLIKGDTDEDRALAAYRLCRRIETAELSNEERHFAEEILRVVVEGAAERVRRALAVTLKSSPNLPPDVARKLARDIEAIALPVLENSPSLTDEDLIEILQEAEPARQFAIARRDALSEDVTDTLCARGVEPAIAMALRNVKAVFSENGLTTALTRFPSSAQMKEAMVERPILPLSVTEKLVAMVSGQVFDRLVERHALPPQMAIDLATSTRERATIDLVSQAANQPDLVRFIQQLNLNGRLTPSFILRALCLGEVRLVEHALAELAGVVHRKAWILVHDGGVMGLRRIYDRAGMPPTLYPAFRTAIDVLHSTEFDGGAADKERFRRRMIERVLTRFQSIPADDLGYLLEKLDYARADASSLFDDGNETEADGSGLRLGAA